MSKLHQNRRRQTNRNPSVRQWSSRQDVVHHTRIQRSGETPSPRIGLAGFARPAAFAEHSSGTDPWAIHASANDASKLTSGLPEGNNSDMSRKTASSTTITDRLRVAIAESGLSFKELQRRTGVVRQSLMKFARGEQSLRLDHADKLAEFFGLELMERKAK